MSDDFYVGYLPRTGTALASHVRRTAAALLVGFVLIAALLVSTMDSFSTATFEFGIERTFEGVLLEAPTPVLLVDRPGQTGPDGDASATSSYLLVAFGKRGARDAIQGLDGHRVRLSGSLVYRDDQTMIELSDAAPEDLGPATTPPPPERDLGTHTLVGEIVDSKCFLGVMKPGNLKPHRACAVRCIAGGIPPVLVTRDRQGLATYHLLVDEDGSAVNSRVLDRVAEPVEIEGRVVERGNLRFLYANPATYR